MKKPYKARFKQSSSKKRPTIHDYYLLPAYATKLQVAFAIRLLREVGLLRPNDELNLRAMRRDRISALINGLQKKRKRQAQGSKPSPEPNQTRDNALSTLGQSQGETPKDVAGLTLQP